MSERSRSDPAAKFARTGGRFCYRTPAEQWPIINVLTATHTHARVCQQTHLDREKVVTPFGNLVATRHSLSTSIAFVHRNERFAIISIAMSQTTTSAKTQLSSKASAFSIEALIAKSPKASSRSEHGDDKLESLGEFSNKFIRFTHSMKMVTKFEVSRKYSKFAKDRSLSVFAS